ncbi:hypothetical protein CP061683_2646, partial [Chlamydia psittaci 06-1683]
GGFVKRKHVIFS